MALDGILVQLFGLVLRVVKLLSWYELHHLNVIFTTNTVVSTGRGKTQIDISFQVKAADSV